MKRNNLIIILLSLAVLFLGYLSWTKDKEVQIQKSELVKWTDKDSLNRAKLEIASNTLTASQSASDSQIKAFQGQVEDLKGKVKSGTRIKTVVEYETVTKTKIVYKDSTIHDTLKLEPTYYSYFKDDYFTGEVITTPDSAFWNLTVKDDISLFVRNEGPFFNRKQYLEVISNNPFSETEQLIYYDNTNKKRFVVFVGGGYGISTEGLVPFVGLGVGVKIFEF